MWVSEGDDESEYISVEIKLDNLNVRVVCGYGPQMNDKIERKLKFWSDMDYQVSEASNNNSGIIIQMDSNAHVGESIITDDKNEMNKNGELLRDFLNRNPTLSVINGTELCVGTITRRRETKTRTEEAILDLFIVCDKILPFVTKMKIDDERRHPLVTRANTFSDHFTTILEMSISIPHIVEERVELFNFRNVDCQEKFKENTEENSKLTECFETEENFDSQCNKWMKNLNETFHESFKKIRIRNRVKESEENILFKEKLQLINEQKKNPSKNDELQKEIDKKEKELSNLVSKKNRDKVVSNFKHLDGSFGDFVTSGVWKIKKKVFPKNQKTLPSAKIDIKGRLITSKSDIKKLHLDTFIFRLRDRPMKEEYLHIKELEEDLCEKRLQLTKNNKSPDWTLDNLEKALGMLKKNKARDPQGIASEIFRPDVAGKELKNSLLMMFNKMKEKCFLPEFAKLKNISTIFKNKGSKTDLENYRGIFVSSIFNSILMTLIYNDNYDIIDENISDSQLGSRKNKALRSHTFIVSGIINEALVKKKEVDVIITDYRQAYDSLFLESVLNDLYDSGVQDDQLNLIHKSDCSSLVAVKTDVGLTDRAEVQKKVLQGEKLGPIKCSNTVDKIGKQCLDENKYLYTYRENVKCPPLALVDDVLAIAKCGADSVEMNSFLNTQTNIKKLQYGTNKCHKMHVGKDRTVCPDLNIDSWKLKPKGDMIENIFDQEEFEDGLSALKEVDHDSYLGDILENTGSNKRNIQARVAKGLNAGKTIVQILDEVCFGPYTTEVFLILRNSLMLSTLLSNGESWYRVTKENIESLESVDTQIIRQQFKLHSKTPTPYLYLDLGLVPVRFLLMKRRILFLWWITNQSEDSLIYQFFQAQENDSYRGDWSRMVREDLENLEIDLTTDQIKCASKEELKRFLNKQIEEQAFKYLINQKNKYSKMSSLKYDKLELQNFFCSDEKLMPSEISSIMQIRSRMLPVKNNFKSSFQSDKMFCRGCLDRRSIEDQTHILLCPVLNGNCPSTNNNLEYEDVFSDNPKKIVEVVRMIMSNHLKLRQILDTKSPSAPSS